VTSSPRLSSALAALLLIAGCAQNAAGTGTVSKQVGYVQTDDLVKRHPLYAELTRVDDGIAALQIRAETAGPDLTPDEIARQDKALQVELNTAADRAQKALHDLQTDFAKRENADVQALIQQAGGALPAPPANAIHNGAVTESNNQANNARAATQSGLESYRDAQIKAGQASLDAARRTLADRADAQYRAKAEELQQKESNFSLAQSHDHAAERLTLRTKLSNLALDDTERAETRARLDAIDREEADALAAVRNRDQAELAAYHQTLGKQMQDELAKRTDAIRKDMVAKMNSQQQAVQQNVISQIGKDGKMTVVAGGGAGYTPDLRSKLDALHQKYQTDFNKEAKVTVDDFQKTKAELSKRYARLHGVDVEAAQSTQREIDRLKKQRDDLYDQIVSEIDSQVRAIAEKRGVNVVVGKVVAPAGGVDLTSDTEKALETLHQ
jgi:hypothetical protein